MNAKQLLEENPLSKDKLKLWFTNELTAQLENFEEDDNFKEFMVKSGITDDQIETIFTKGGRGCLDFFDEEGLIISVVHNWKDKTFSYYVNDDKPQGSFSKRTDAETAVLQECIKTLEQTLTEKEETDDNSEN